LRCESGPLADRWQGYHVRARPVRVQRAAQKPTTAGD
jgi:hypothetical protein